MTKPNDELKGMPEEVRILRVNAYGVCVVSNAPAATTYVRKDLAPTSQWRDISECPRDNKYKLGWGIVDDETGNWTTELIVWDGDKCEWRGWPRYCGQPTHWMPLPAAPPTKDLADAGKEKS